MSKYSNLLHIVDFKTEKIIGAIKEQDYWDDIRKWQLKNNEDQFEFTTMDGTKIAASLMQQNLVIKRVRDGSFVSYIITEVEQDSTGRYKKVYTLSEHTKLKKTKYIKPQTLQAYTVNQAIDFALGETKWKRGTTEYAGVRTIHIKEFTNSLDLLKEIASTFELEIRYRTEIQGSFIVGRYVDMVQKVGRDNGKEIVLGKDLQGIRRIENSQKIVTALVGVGPQDSETGEYLTFEKINNGKLYVGDNDALQRWSEDGTHLFDIYSPETEDQDMTAERLLQLTKTELKKRIDTSVLYEVDVVALEQVFGLYHEAVHKGDFVSIKDKGFTPALFLEARLIAADECDKDPSKDKYYFGEFREIVNTDDELRKLYNKILGSLSSKANKELVDQLEKLANQAQETANNSKQTADDASSAAQAAKDIADAVAQKQKDFQTKIVKSTTPPPNPEKDVTLWLDISNPDKPILYLWDGTKWDRLTPDTSIIDNDIKSIEDEIKKLQTEVGSKVNQQWVKDQIQTDIQNKADIKDVYKKTEIDQALQGHVKVQSYEIDKQAIQDDITNNTNKINENDQSYIKRFTENESKITQTETDIKTQIEQLSVTNKRIDSQGNTIDEVQKKTNEIVQDANGTKQTITDIQTELKNQLATARNVLTNSNFIDGMNTWKTLWSKVEIRDMDGEIHPEFSKYARIEKIDVDDTWLDKDLDVVPGEYIISAWIRSVDGSFATIGVKDNANGASGDPGVKYFFFKADDTMTDGKWHHLYGKFKIEHGRVRVYFGLRKSSSTVGQKIDITGVKLANGNIVDNWTIAPEDMTYNTDFTKKTAEIITSVDQVSSKLSKTEQNVTTVSNDVKKAQETADNANTAATNADKKAGAAQTAADNADKKAQEAQTQITTTNKKVSEVSQTVSDLQVNISNVSKIQTQQGNDIKNAQTELQQQSAQIKANADAISTKVGAEYVQDYTGGLGIHNKFRDADFALAVDNNLKYWNVNKGGDGNVEFIKGGGHEGFNSCRVTGRADTTQVHANFSHFFAAGEITGEVDYVVSAYAFAETAPTSGQNANVYFNYYASDGKQISAENKQLTLAVGAHIKTDVPFKPPVGTVRTRIRFYAAGVGFVVRFSKPMVTNGKTGTTFTLNPKDYTDYDKLVDDIASRVLTEDYDKKMSEVSTQFIQTAQALELKADTKNVYTKNEVDGKNDAIVESMNAQFKVQAGEINSKVTKGQSISEINQSAEAVKIKAGKIELDGNAVAKSLEAQLLQGVTIKTAQSDRFVEMTQQYMTLYEKSIPRAFWGFFNRTDGSVRPALVLGSDSFAGSNMTGSLVLNNIINPSNLTESVGSIEMVKDSSFNTYSSNIQLLFFRNSGQFEATSDGLQWFSSGTGEFYFHKKGVNNTNVMCLVRSDYDSDLRLANFVIRGSAHPDYSEALQFKTRGGSWADLKAARFLNTSQRSLKAYIKDLTFSPLEKILESNVQEYYFKSDIANLYEIRENDPDNLHTIKEIKKSIGLIADDADEVFAGEKHETIDIYSMASVTMAGLKEHVLAQNEVNNRLTEENKQLNERVARLEALVQSLIEQNGQTDTPTTEEPGGTEEGGTTEQTDPIEQQ
ncbi:phage tail spike protein [Bacillus bingmayongensis]|uniref:phage tail spike protein n=1 Tax=Bacillus bingmayongensis TaxID=1150157 RepID=UPI0003050D97|nr:phage tail spike protein [Bacillus bingmayongensis]